KQLAKRHGRGPVGVDPAALALLLAYDWPGNIRELQNVLERALVLAAQEVIGPEHLPPTVRESQESPPAIPRENGPESTPMTSLANVEKQHVLGVLAALRGNQDRAARVLGVSRRTLS